MTRPGSHASSTVGDFCGERARCAELPQNLAANATYVFRISLNDGTHIDFRYGLK